VVFDANNEASIGRLSLGWKFGVVNETDAAGSGGHARANSVD
jgi:hypothetical protein